MGVSAVELFVAALERLNVRTLEWVAAAHQSVDVGPGSECIQSLQWQLRLQTGHPPARRCGKKNGGAGVPFILLVATGFSDLGV